MSMGRPAKGFTLIELLVAVSILVIIMGIVAPLVGQTMQARERAAIPSKVVALIKRAQALAESRETPTRVLIDYGSRVAALQIKSGTSWVDIEHIALPASLPEVKARKPTEVVAFDVRGILDASKDKVSVSLNRKSLSVTRWGEITLR